jgi:hypothetical protein
MDHAANLVAAFFRGCGMLGPTDPTLRGLPGEFLLELAALLQFKEWQSAGVIEWCDQDGLSIEDRIRLAIQTLKDDPKKMLGGCRGREAMKSMLRAWTESCSPSARECLGCDVALRWDATIDTEAIIDDFADFLCRHSNAASFSGSSR